MARLSDAIAANTPRKGPSCSPGAVIAKLSKADQADLAAAFADRLITTTAIRRGLIAIGHRVDETSLRRHRKGECACPR